ncbi:DUF4097 family beta strand repeat-containing protein [Spirosoma fluviale]|uniref:Uncharacterized protein n=1 Tax=Spirosoma fluviale TaxID=1597977 RepID=A0A286GK85_9BACT|nr:DUF4097 family beta strand repeat-containing protein [Spirosoma fluviale]SOD95912.1 hypothetical protein SAMN06269250_5044 [Spirosoma fluviale]
MKQLLVTAHRVGMALVRRLGLAVFLLFPAMPGIAQVSMQVVTKVVEKDLPYTDGQRIRLVAQKADVVVKGWNRPTVSIRLRLVARHPDRAVAEREVAYHQYVLQAENGRIELSNQFIIPQRAGKLQSQLKAIYEISLPNKALLILKNSFGDIRLTDLAGDVSVNFEFGKLTLEDIGGKLTVVSNYGDIDGRNLDGTLTLKAEKADVSLRELGGTAVLQSRYGKLTVFPATTSHALTIEAARTEILIATKRISDFKFDVISTFADIRVPDWLADQLSKYNGKQVFTYQPAGRKPEITIQNSYSTVVIQGEKTLVDR